MIIKPYGDLPRAYAPDIGEVVDARRTPADDFTSAVVVGVRRIRSGDLKIRVQWMADNPRAGSGDPRFNEPIKAGTLGFLVLGGDGPPLIRQVNRGPSS